MVTKGFLFLYNNPATRQLEYVCANMGDSPGVMTHNVFQSQSDATIIGGHDDNVRYGHGDGVPHGTETNPGIARRAFPMGGPYHNLRIEPGNWFRVGFRNRAFKPVEIPVPGEAVVIPYEELQRGDAYGYNLGWEVEPVRLKAQSIASSDHGLANIMAVLQRGPVRFVEGRVEIKPVEDQESPGSLAGWEVWFHNTCARPPTVGRTTGFIGTVVLVNERGDGAKNAGLGLESQTCPQGGWSVMQFIESEGDYGIAKHGVRAIPGTDVRLGIRGHSSAHAKLPSLADGPMELDLKAFTEEAIESRSDWFESDDLMPKVGEKKGLLEIYRDGRRVNDELPDAIYRGADAIEKAEFKDPPQVDVEWIDAHPQFREGGWRVRMASLLPEADEIGAVGFVGRILVGHDGVGYDDPELLPAKTFTPSDREAEWFLSASRKLAGKILKPGDTLLIDSGALGWRGELRLPRRGAIALPRAMEPSTAEAFKKAWILRESDFKRARLTPEAPLRGADANRESPFPAPRIRVESVDPSDEVPFGGWIITVESRLPKDDQKGAIGFVATLTLGEAGSDPAQLPDKKFTEPGDINRWVLPNAAEIGICEAQPGVRLTIGTPGLGWQAMLQLPGPGEARDSEDEPDLWSYRPLEFKRRRLSLASVDRCALGPDR